MLRVIPVEPAEASVQEAVATLRAGGLVAFRTDTLYGISADPAHAGAMARLRALKSRATGGFVSLASDVAMALAASSGIDPRVTRLVTQCWPGPVTLVLAAGESLAPGLRSPDGSWAVRVPDQPWCRCLVSRLGAPLPSTSANLPGRPPVRAATDLAADLGDDLDLAVDGGGVPAETPASALVDARAWPPRLLRGGGPELAAMLR
ncbi:MAG: L-threonylcarbamoyladenylate synthase [Candidatus Eisenbacteria bacterium]|nr:L-threonylcarbamoyladenylate synthase [Candidatus Eisenbacteria bacterium]